jgi:hypothetical protein
MHSRTTKTAAAGPCDSRRQHGNRQAGKARPAGVVMERVPRSRTALGVRRAEGLDGGRRPGAARPGPGGRRSPAISWRSMRDSLHSRSGRLLFASPAEIFADLLAIDEEFDEFTWDGKDRTLAVSTPPITMDDVHLGRFWIETALAEPAAAAPGLLSRGRPGAEPSRDRRQRHASPRPGRAPVRGGRPGTAIHRALSQGPAAWISSSSSAACWRPTTPPAPTSRSRTWGGTPLRRLRRCALPRDEASRCCACSTRLVCDECRSLLRRGATNDYCTECISRCTVCRRRQGAAPDASRPAARCGQAGLRQGWPSPPTAAAKDCHDEDQNESGDPDAAVQPDRVGQAPVPA